MLVPHKNAISDTVHVRSRSQIVKPDALFVVFLGIKWAHDTVKKIDHEFMGIFGPAILAFLQGKTAQKEHFFQNWLISHPKVVNT